MATQAMASSGTSSASETNGLAISANPTNVHNKPMAKRAQGGKPFRILLSNPASLDALIIH
jgi:hypothetical protein